MPEIFKTGAAIPTKKESTNNPAVRISGVRKEYRLYNSLTEQAIDVLGFSRLRFWRQTHFKTFVALDDINLEIGHGERVGIIGRNGAGKTTLLKLITGNFAPTAGEIEIDGEIQALMQTGLGFHGEFTGYENIRSSLIYSGLTGEELQSAVADIIEFCELGDFLNQPVKTYSLGMRTRLQFAAATAIKPDIVIVDEVLGAGDAYFNAKSSGRMAKLAESGCTLLIVSHSMQQVLQYCNRVIWLEEGRIVEDNMALPVVKAYERSMFEKTSSANRKNISENDNVDSGNLGVSGKFADYGVSRWSQGDTPIKISQVTMYNKVHERSIRFRTGDYMGIEIEVQAQEKGMFPCRFVVLIFNSAGVEVTWHLSQEYMLEVEREEKRSIILNFDKLLLMSGSYLISCAIFEFYDELNKNNSKCYDLLSRSFEFFVENNYSGSPAIIQHPSMWELIKSNK